MKEDKQSKFPEEIFTFTTHISHIPSCTKPAGVPQKSALLSPSVQGAQGPPEYLLLFDRRQNDGGRILRHGWDSVRIAKRVSQIFHLGFNNL